MSSSIGPAGLALFALLQTASTTSASPLYQVQVAFGGPDQYQQQELVAIVGVSTLGELSIVLGSQPGKRDEEYSLDVVVRCEKPAGSSADVWSRAWEMYDAVRAIVMANQTLTSTVFSAFPVPSSMAWGTPQSPSGEDMPGWVMRVDMTVLCKFRAA